MSSNRRSLRSNTSQVLEKIFSQINVEHIHVPGHYNKLQAKYMAEIEKHETVAEDLTGKFDEDAKRFSRNRLGVLKNELAIDR